MGKTVLVIGAGVLGAATALRLAEDGHAVTLVDAGEPQETASHGSLAWLNASSTADPSYARLRALSLTLWRDRIAPEAPEGILRFPGALLWPENVPDLQAAAQRLAGLGLTADVIERDRIRTLLPLLADPPVQALLVAEEGAADPRRVTLWFRECAGAAGVGMATGRVSALMSEANRITGAVLADGTRLSADETVLMAGIGGPALLEPFGIGIPLRHAPGALVITEPCPPMAAPVLASPGLDLWQDSQGRFLVATGTAATLNAGPQGPGADAMAALARLFPATAGLAIATEHLRNRPVPLDGFPVVGRPGAVDNLFLAVTHSGMTLTPVIAEAASRAIAGTDPLPEFAPYTPDRPFAEAQDRRRA